MPHASRGPVEETKIPRVFVSYTHESPEHKRWVSTLATTLRENGVDVVLDQWDLGLGDDATLFMEREIRTADRVLLVCTPTYCKKANEGKGGVGYERLVVTGEIASQIDTNKFICVLKLGKREDSIPIFATTRIYVDFTGADEFQVAFEQLLRDIHQAPANPKPPVGPNPFKSRYAPLERTSATNAVPLEPDDIETVYAQAVRLITVGDMLGWKSFIRNIRRTFPERLICWRDSVEKIAGTGGNEWHMAVDDALTVASPLMCATLVAVDSEGDGFTDQKAILDDLLQLTNWNRAGWTNLVDTPKLIAHVFHHLMGGIHLNNGAHARAINLLTTSMQSDSRQESGPLWNDANLMFAPGVITDSCTQFWGFLVRTYTGHRWLSHFFVDQKEFENSVRGYKALGSIVELASRVVDDPQLERLQYGPTVPPVFLGPSLDARDLPAPDAVIAKAVPNAAAIDAVCHATGCSRKLLGIAWPKWWDLLVQYYGKLYQNSIAGRFAPTQWKQPPRLPR